MSTEKRPLAVLCSDLHLSETAPVARSGEPDWYAAMARPLRQFRVLCKKYRVPGVVAGDVFDKWNPRPALIAFALKQLPKVCYGIPGQHDLPYHELTGMERSAFGVLVQVGAVRYLAPGTAHELSEGFFVHGFPWGVPITPVEQRRKGDVHLAVVHGYIWKNARTAYTGAKDTQKVSAYAEQLHGYDAAVFGDNHKGFLGVAGNCIVFNHGGFMRRKSDELDWVPSFGVLYSDGTVELVPQDVSMDVMERTAKDKLVETAGDFNMSEFINDLSTLDATELDFREAMKVYFNNYEVSPGAKKIINTHLQK